MSHSPIPPSSAAIWAPETGCPGWRGMAAQFPETERSEPAEQGTAAHELAAQMAEALTRAGVGFPDLADVVGKPASNGVVFDADMYAAATEYAATVRPLMRETGVFGGDNLGIESPVRAPSIHAESYGTPDFYLYDKDNHEIHIADFKYGFGVVEVFESWQLLNYAAAVIDTLDIDQRGLTISMNIVQPRAFHRDGINRQWRITADQAAPFFTQLRRGAARAFEPDAPAHSGPHCKYCPARHACPAAVAAGMQMLEATTEAVPLLMSTGELALAYTQAARALAQLSSLVLGYETELKALARSGESIPGYRSEPVQGHLEWTKPDPEVLRLGELMGHDLRQKKTITPTQAKALGIDSTLVDAYSEKPQRGVKLVQDDGKQARKVFQS